MKKSILLLPIYILSLTISSCGSGAGSSATPPTEQSPQDITTEMFLAKFKKTASPYLFDINYQGIGKLEDAWTENDTKGRQVKMKTFHGIVYRGDSRNLLAICNSGGFKSRNDLTIRKNLYEAYGIGTDENGNISEGATGQSGVSTAKAFMNAVYYSNGHVYVIDSQNLLSFDMPTISIQYKGIDETGGEVNILNIPCDNIIGYYKVDAVDLNSIDSLATQNKIKATFIANPQYKLNKNLYSLMN
ncbi:MAG: hypothetical protein PHC75_07650 [Burkholderiales bacterium]|nr:hypothetical protein [Burkholderiales bacterium]